MGDLHRLRDMPRNVHVYGEPTPLQRFADAIGIAMFVIFLASLLALFAALFGGAYDAAWAFLGAAIGAAVTMLLAHIFEQQVSK